MCSRWVWLASLDSVWSFVIIGNMAGGDSANLLLPNSVHFNSHLPIYQQVRGSILSGHALMIVLGRIRLAAGYDSSFAANYFFWFMHSITLTLHGKHSNQHW